MTVFVLHGGAPTQDTPGNADFYKFMAEQVPEGGVWLGCYFANIAEKEALKFATDSQTLQGVATRDFRIEMATVEAFEAQVKVADVVYFAGGSTKGLMNQIAVWPELAAWLKKVKVVAGSSAGMNMLGRGYLSKDGTKGNGLGLVPFNILVHHTAPEYAAAQQGKPFAGPVLAMHEAQFCVLELDL